MYTAIAVRLNSIQAKMQKKLASKERNRSPAVLNCRKPFNPQKIYSHWSSSPNNGNICPNVLPL